MPIIQILQYAYIQAAKDKGYDVLLMDGILDNHFVNLMEQKAKYQQICKLTVMLLTS